MILSIFSVCFFGLCILAALIDIETMTIPNWLNGWLAFLFIPACIVAAPGWEVVGMHLLVGAIAFVVSVLLFTLRVYGGGDAKMIPAVMLWIGPAGSLDFLINTAFAGGVLTIIVLIGRVLVPAQASAGFGLATLKEGRGVPYAVAISTGALIASPHSQMIANLFN